MVLTLMKLTYETGISTLVQFVAISLLNIVTQIIAIIKDCHPTAEAASGSCATGVFSSVGYFMLLVIWFGIIWMLGYQTQQRRSRKLAVVLIFLEFMVAVIAYHNAKHFPDPVSLITSIANVGFAIWTIVLAIRLIRARGGRIVASERSRARKRPSTKL